METPKKVPKAPGGISGRGFAFWKYCNEQYEFEADERLILVEVCRLVTSLDECVATLARDGFTASGYNGNAIPHPAVAIVDRQRALLSKLVAQLALPHPGGTAVPSHRTVSARNAARERWNNPPNGSAISDAARAAVTARWQRTGGRIS